MRPHPEDHPADTESPLPGALKQGVQQLDAWQAELSPAEQARLNLARQQALAAATEGGHAPQRRLRPPLWLAGATAAGLLLVSGVMQLRPTAGPASAQITTATAQASEPSALWDIPADELLDEDLELSLLLSGLDDAS